MAFKIYSVPMQRTMTQTVMVEIEATSVDSAIQKANASRENVEWQTDDVNYEDIDPEDVEVA
jgi:hypothetical protein